MPGRSLPFAIVVLTAAVLHAGEVVLPDPRQGSVNGRAAMLFWPASLPEKPWGDAQPLPSAGGCEVHLVPHADRDEELRYPCGQWLAPPVGRYNVWLEKDGAVTPEAQVMNYAGTPFRGAGMMAMLWLVPAGRVTLPPDRTLQAGESLRLLSLEDGDWWNQGRRTFERRSDDPRATLQMPAGRAIAGRFERVTGDAIALSRPVQVQPGRTTAVWPAEPAASDMLAVLEKPRPLRQRTAPPRVELRAGSVIRAPDVLIDGLDRVIAVWYGVAAPAAQLSVVSQDYVFPPREVRLARGRVATVRATMNRP